MLPFLAMWPGTFRSGPSQASHGIYLDRMNFHLGGGLPCTYGQPLGFSSPQSMIVSIGAPCA